MLIFVLDFLKTNALIVIKIETQVKKIINELQVISEQAASPALLNRFTQAKYSVGQDIENSNVEMFMEEFIA